MRGDGAANQLLAVRYLQFTTETPFIVSVKSGYGQPRTIVFRIAAKKLPVCRS